MAVIRMAAFSDAAAIAAIYRPAVLDSPISFEIDPPDDAEIRRRIANTVPQHPWLVYERDARVLGYAYAAPHRTRAAYRWSVDAAVYVDVAHHRQGIGRALYASLFAVLAAQGYYTAYAGITLPNPGSVGLHERVGFAPVGIYRNVGYKAGAWRDVGWWALSLREHDAAPVPPIDIDALSRRPDWPALLSRGLDAVPR